MSIKSELHLAPAIVPGVPADHRQHILVVDDDPYVSGVEEIFLQNAGFKVDTADGGSAAWELLVHRNYDLLLTDYLMPGISGIALTRQLRVAGLSLPVVLVTGSLDSLDPASLSRDPWIRIRCCVSKPFTEEVLVTAACEALGLTAGDRLHRGRD